MIREIVVAAMIGALVFGGSYAAVMGSRNHLLELWCFKNGSDPLKHVMRITGPGIPEYAIARAGYDAVVRGNCVYGTSIVIDSPVRSLTPRPNHSATTAVSFSTSSAR